MKKHLTQILIIAAVLLFLTFHGSAWAQTRIDHSVFAPLLRTHVQDGKVDYDGFKKNESQLDTYLDILSEVDPDQLERSERMAFYINAYNAWTIKLILGRYPDLKSIKDLGTIFKSPWKKKFVKLNGQKVTLDHIEHDILRPQFKDPRIHFAVNCASISCPPLLDEPYRGDDLEMVTQRFINDKLSNYLKDETLYVSRIFKWFDEDFNKDIKTFFTKYATPDLAEALEASGANLRIKYLEYDWSLNDT